MSAFLSGERRAKPNMPLGPKTSAQETRITLLALPRPGSRSHQHLSSAAALAFVLLCCFGVHLPLLAHSASIAHSAPVPEVHPAGHSRTHQQQPLAALQRLQARAQSGKNVVSQREAAWQWGLLQLHGLHTPQQAAQARRSFEKAYDLGYPLAAAGLIWCAIDGCGQTPHPGAAVRWLPSLRGVDSGRAAYFEWLLRAQADCNGTTTPLMTRQVPTEDTPSSTRLLQQAVQKGDAMAQVELGMRLAAQNKAIEAIAQFRAAAQHSEAARNNLKVLERQDSAAQATISNLPGQAEKAQKIFLQARQYHRGDGIPVNYTEAVRLYRRATDLGNEGAKRVLTLITSRPASGNAIDMAWMQQLAYMDVAQDFVNQAPTPLSNLVRDPTPLYDYVDSRWRN